MCCTPLLRAKAKKPNHSRTGKARKNIPCLDGRQRESPSTARKISAIGVLTRNTTGKNIGLVPVKTSPIMKESLFSPATACQAAPEKNDGKGIGSLNTTKSATPETAGGRPEEIPSKTGTYFGGTEDARVPNWNW